MKLDDHTPGALREMRARLAEWAHDAESAAARAAERADAERAEQAIQSERADWAANIVLKITAQLRRFEADDDGDAPTYWPCNAPTPDASPFCNCTRERGHDGSHAVVDPETGRHCEVWDDAECGGPQCARSACDDMGELAPPYLCTRWEGHDGKHIARDTGNMIRASWTATTTTPDDHFQ